MIPFLVPNYDGSEYNYIRAALRHEMGEDGLDCVKLFEEGVAKVAGAKYSVATNSGTAALHVALLAVGVKPGDLVIMPSLTFIATANAIAYCGAEPWLFDVDKDNWNIDLDLLENELKANMIVNERGFMVHKETRRRVSAIVPVYLFGLPCDLKRLSDISAKWCIPVVADACQAFGSTYGGMGLQSDKLHIKATVFSFNRSKVVTCGGGGMVVTNSSKFAHDIKHLISTARIGPGYRHNKLGYNYMMPQVNAALGYGQLSRLEGFLQRKCQIRRAYRRLSNSLDNIGFFPGSSKFSESSFWMSGVVIGKAGVIVEALAKEKVECRMIYQPIHMQKAFARCVRTKQNVSEYLSNRVLMLPSSSNMIDQELGIVIDTIGEML